jgi:tripartite-type tricarboxylate transporter receptor subunit TctC
MSPIVLQRRTLLTQFARAAVATAIGAPGLASAADTDYPNRLINLIVPYNAGATPDIIARLVGPKLLAAMGQPVVVMNRAGAGSDIGTRAIVGAAPDGYTFGIVGNPQTIHHLLNKNPGYRFARDVTPITNAAAGFYALVLNPQRVNARSVGEVVAYAKANPGKLQYGSGGVATSPHLVGEWFKSLTGTDILHVPYSGTSGQTLALLNGEIDLAFTSPIYVAQHVKNGKLRPLAVTLPQRDSTFFPDVPTMRASGVDMTYEYWIGFVGPAGMPDAIAERLNKEIVAILKLPEIGETLRQAGLTPVGDTRDHFRATIENETLLMTRLIQSAKIEPN